MEMHERRVARSARRVGAVAVGLMNLTGASFLGLLGLLANAMRCDDNCALGVPGWRNDPNAWQWSAELAIAVAILAAAVALNVSLWTRRRRRWMVAAVVIQLSGLALLTVLAATAEAATGNGRDFLARLTAFFAASGAGCIALAESRRLE
jgi:hypothetical protein